ncbi:MAG: bifunctional oligoribonuclease/PAP phosphatase NrnA [Lachnospira sp.]
MKLSELNKYNRIVIQVHDNPDADAVGSGYAIYRYFQEQNKDIRLVYGGKNVIAKSNMLLMIAELEIPIEYVGNETDLGKPELLITVDCQYGEGNVQRFEAVNIAMIDHHSTGRISGDMSEIRSNLVSCATVCYAMLKDSGFRINEDYKVSTALYYGLYMDSNQLAEITHPLDRDMVEFLNYDKSLINRLKYANFSLSELETAGIAITNNRYIEKHRTAIVNSKPCDPNILGVIGDFVIQVDSIDVCIIYNQCPGGYKLSVRSCAVDVAANELATFISREIGNGGGHLTKAGGFISQNRYKEYHGSKPIEEYIEEKIDEYYEGFDVVRYNEIPKDFSGYVRYRKKAATYGYVRGADLFIPGTEFKIRTLEGDVILTSRDDIYLMIGYSGEVYPIEKNVFESKYQSTNEAFVKEFEYAPAVIDIAKGEYYPIMPLAKKCVSGFGSPVLARKITKYTKVFTRWDYEGHMAGNVNDMLCYSETDKRDVYVVKKDVFEMTYELYQ